jgi:hypothetical protein
MGTINISICQNNDLMITQRILAEFLTLQPIPNVNIYRLNMDFSNRQPKLFKFS